MPLPRTITYRRVVSLSHPIHPAIPAWPGDPPVQVEPVATYEQEGYFLRKLALGEHSATLASAPAAFFPGAPGVDQYPPETLVAPAAVTRAWLVVGLLPLVGGSGSPAAVLALVP